MKQEKDNSEFFSNHHFYEPVYTPAVAAKKLGISTHSLRLYEAEGLLIPYRTETGRRLYSNLEMEKVKSIRNMIQNQGNNFEGIRRLLALAPCWKIRGCSLDQWKVCTKDNTIGMPCWATEEKCGEQHVTTCRECPVYTKLITYEDIIEFIHS